MVRGFASERVLRGFGSWIHRAKAVKLVVVAGGSFGYGRLISMMSYDRLNMVEPPPPKIQVFFVRSDDWSVGEFAIGFECSQNVRKLNHNHQSK